MIFGVAMASGFSPVTTRLDDHSLVNWTEMQIEVSVVAVPPGAAGVRATEEIARRDVEGRMREVFLGVGLDPARSVEDLRSVPELWSQIEPRVLRWLEVENQYYSSGRVGVVGALPLVQLLKPLTMATATERPPPQKASHTGAVIDARGLEVKPCFAPEIHGPRGEIYDGRVWLHAAAEQAPVVWVNDAAHPAAARAGTTPLLLHATAADGCKLTVDDASAGPLQGLDRAGLLGQGTLVVVVDD